MRDAISIQRRQHCARDFARRKIINRKLTNILIMDDTVQPDQDLRGLKVVHASVRQQRLLVVGASRTLRADLITLEHLLAPIQPGGLTFKPISSSSHK